MKKCREIFAYYVILLMRLEIRKYSIKFYLYLKKRYLCITEKDILLS